MSLSAALAGRADDCGESARGASATYALPSWILEEHVRQRSKRGERVRMPLAEHRGDEKQFACSPADALLDREREKKKGKLRRRNSSKWLVSAELH